MIRNLFSFVLGFPSSLLRWEPMQNLYLGVGSFEVSDHVTVCCFKHVCVSGEENPPGPSQVEILV